MGKTYRKRDVFEIELLKQAVANNKAILGICRGLQLINVGLGGTLYQDLSEDATAYIKHSQAAMGNQPSHHITVTPGSMLSTLVGSRPYVNSRHHQAVKDVAPSLQVTAIADDHVVEALESPDSDQILAVQWHPENMYKHHEDSRQIFANFVQRAAKRTTTL